MLRTLETLAFDNAYARLPAAFSTRVAPTPLAGARLLSWNPAGAALLDLDPGEAARPELVRYLNGELPWPGTEPLAQVYAGHQFGVWVPRLGDGRALLLGQVRNARGERWDLHLKGAGRTPYSRMGDGRAVLRSTIREYLCGEAMAGLGIPTTRALCVLASEAPVVREEVEPGALLLRLAPSHVRLGTFEYFAHTGDPALVPVLLDHVVELFLPALRELPLPARAAAFLAEVARRTALLFAEWQAVGFCHGVLNTDNLSVLGVTLDYGPFGFLDDYDAGHVCNHSDHTGRYAFDRQPDVGLWNLSRLALALLPLADPERERPRHGTVTLPDALVAALEPYGELLVGRWLERMGQKLGLSEGLERDDPLLTELLELLESARADYTLFFRRLRAVSAADRHEDAAGPLPAELAELFPCAGRLRPWLARYTARLRAEGSQDEARRARMTAANPALVLRNYLAQDAIDAAHRGDAGPLEALLAALRDPFRPELDASPLAAPPPAWGKRLQVSCSS